MGQSTDAILFLGFHLNEDFELPWGDETDFEDFDDWLVSDEDLPPSPWADLPELGHLSFPERRTATDAWVAENRGAIDAHREATAAAIARVGDGVIHRTHCSDSYPMAYFYTQAVSASRGFPESITALPSPTEQELTALRQMAEWLNVENPEIGWWLVSYWA